MRKCPSITTRRKIHALVGRGQGSDIYLAQPEQALFLCRHPDDAESKEARFGALIEACERAGCLARLARYPLLRDELAAFQAYLRERGERGEHDKLELLLSLTLLQPHEQQLHNVKKIAQKVAPNFDKRGDVAEGPVALLQMLKQIIPPALWESA